MIQDRNTVVPDARECVDDWNQNIRSGKYSIKDNILRTPKGVFDLAGVTDVSNEPRKDWSIYAGIIFSRFCQDY